MDPTDYKGLTDQGLLGMATLFFGTVSIGLFYMLYKKMSEYPAALIAIIREQITATNAHTQSNKDLAQAVMANTETLKELRKA